VREHAYASKSVGKRRGLVVYTPPGYDQELSGHYPVLYLFHGAGDNEGTWTAIGRAHWIADNLLAQGKCRRMIVVMTDGHAQAPGAATPEVRGQALAVFQKDLLEDVMPFVESNYRTLPGPTNRAIVGLSMGGGQSMTIGLNHPELFAWVGGMSSAIFNPEQTVQAALADASVSNAKFKLLWFACGKDDFLLKQNKQLDELLSARGIHHEFTETDGNHSWPVWRRHLVEFLPRIFKMN
jgi:enterochelin esterase family protein